MAVLLNIISLLLSTMTLALSLPARLSREVVQPQSRSPVSITQISQAGYTQATFARYTGDCIEVRDTNVPTRIEVDSNAINPEAGDYELVAFGTDCSGSGEPTFSQAIRRPMLVNNRIPICSFKLNKHPLTTEPVTVAFNGAASINEKIVGNTDCVDICTGSSWTEYAQTVEVHVNRQRTNNPLTLFSDKNCESQVMSQVESGTDLVTPTRQDSRVIKSFLIANKR